MLDIEQLYFLVKHGFNIEAIPLEQVSQLMDGNIMT